MRNYLTIQLHDSGQISPQSFNMVKVSIVDTRKVRQIQIFAWKHMLTLKFYIPCFF